jgi:hypothetical protein
MIVLFVKNEMARESSGLPPEGWSGFESGCGKTTLGMVAFADELPGTLHRKGAFKAE